VETSPSSSSAISDHEDMAPEYSDPSDSSIGDSGENSNLNSDESQDSADEQNVCQILEYACTAWNP